MLRYRRFLPVLAVAFLVQADFGLAQSLSARKPSLSTRSGGNIVQAVACGPTTITESSSNTITPLNSVACNSGGLSLDNHYWRAFDLTGMGLTTDFHVCEVTIGVETATSVDGTQPITVNLYTSDPAFPDGALTPIGTAGFSVPDQSGTLLTIPVSGSAPAGSQLVVEIFVPSGQAAGNSFFIGSNTAAETAPSYISAPACGIVTPTPTDGLVDGLIMHIVMSASGTASGPVAMTVDPPLGIAVQGNGVLEIGAPTLIAPAWANGGATDFSLTGIASNLAGPFGPIYAIGDPAADYGVITAGSSKNCLSGTPDCYTITISGARPVQHFDVTLDETVTPSPLTLQNDVILKTWTLHVGESFTDVTPDGPDAAYYPSIENIFHHAITGGCHAGTEYCPQAPNLRSEMAVFLGKASNPPGYAPPDCAGIFSDVPCPATPEFPYSNWIEAIYPNITAGCSSDPGPPPTIQYCPDQAIPRSQMAVFLDKASHPPGYAPPGCVGVFSDVPCPATPEFPYSDFIEDIYNQGITAGCSSDPGPPPTIQYCPDQPVTRETMAVFIALTFKLVLYGP